MVKFKVLITDFIFMNQDIEEQLLGSIGAEIILAPAADEDSLAALAEDADAILVTYANITAKVIHAAVKCKIIARYGIGTNNIDIAAASAQNIMVTNVPDYCLSEVADHTLALMLTCLRKTAYLSQAIKSGCYNVNLARPIPRLNTLTVGLLGFGHIAQAVAVRVQAFGMQVMAYDPFVTADVFAAHQVARAITVAELAATADILSLHAPLTAATHEIINAAVFANMRKGSYLINTSRGPLVNEKDLCAALEENIIAGCGLDVLAIEPCDFNSPLLKFDQVILTPHAAFYSEGSEIELREKAVKQVVIALTDGHPQYWVNRLD